MIVTLDDPVGEVKVTVNPIKWASVKKEYHPALSLRRIINRSYQVFLGCTQGKFRQFEGEQRNYAENLKEEHLVKKH